MHNDVMKKSDLNLLKVFRQHNGLARTGDLLKVGVQSKTVRALLEQGKIEKVSRGLYRLIEYECPANASLVEVAKIAPNGIVCLLFGCLSFQVRLSRRVLKNIKLIIMR